MDSVLYVGIDTSLGTHVVCAMAPDGRVVARTTVPNDQAGAEQLVAWLHRHAAPYARLAVGVEATSVYHVPLMEWLAQTPALQRWQPTWYVLNPKVVQKFGETYVDRGKTDRADAALIADVVRFGRVPPWTPPDPRYAALQVLTRHRRQLSHLITQEKNRALVQLFCIWGQYGQTDEPFFSNVFGVASQTVLERYTPDTLAAIPLADLVAEIAAAGRQRLKAPDDIAQTLHRLARRAFRLHPDEQDARHQSLVLHLDTIRALEHQQQALDTVIARDMQAFRQTLTTIPGIGPVYGAGLLAEIGPIERFPSENALAKYAGLTWRPHQSGTFDADIRPLTRTGNVYLRYYFIEAAERVRVRDPQFKAFYEKKYHEATHHAHKRALVLTARKLVGVVYGMLTRGQIYDARKLMPH
jgi:transposase